MSITACAGRHALCRREGFRKFRPFGHCRNAAKAGIIGFTKALALENAAKGITVNAVAPGYVATDMVKAVPADALATVIARIPVGRLAEPEEIARAVQFLVADETRFMTGATLSINGGQYMA